MTLTSILLIEDNDDDYEAVVRAFRKAGVANPVHWARSGVEAMRRLGGTEAVAPGLILLDLNLPGMDGRRILQLIKKNPLTRSIPVVILTTSADERDVRDCYDLGANTYMQKPVEFDALTDAARGLSGYWFDIAMLPR